MINAKQAQTNTNLFKTNFEQEYKEYLQRIESRIIDDSSKGQSSCVCFLSKEVRDGYVSKSFSQGEREAIFSYLEKLGFTVQYPVTNYECGMNPSFYAAYKISSNAYIIRW